ncbi:unnamed protein product [Pieris macdunnoughi]|uniref:Uncharacterized protein n=1 Tax=Pieris macdunnoughi TaxID=345717 RepID=A0A821L821_9NEOP|nr:unnamed protein product [Pieris macdunnoughi]
MIQDKEDVSGKLKPEVMMISNLQAEQQYLRDDRDRQCNRKHMGDKGKNNAEKEVEEGQTIETREPFKRPYNIEESGNWKRRKTSPEPNDSEEAAENGHNDASVKDWVQSVDELLEAVGYDKDALAEINEKDIEKEDTDEQPVSKVKVENNTITDEENEIKSEVMSEDENPLSKRITRGRGRGRRRN